MSASTANRKLDSGGFSCHMESCVNGVAWVVVGGEIDLCTTPHVSHALAEAFAGGASVVLDLRAVSFCDSTAIHAIIDAEQHARDNDHRLVILEGAAQVHRLFELIGLLGRLDIVRDPDGLVTPGTARGAASPVPATTRHERT